MEELKMENKNFKLSDLKTGMRLVDRKNEEWIVLKNVKTPYGDVEDMYISTKRWMDV